MALITSSNANSKTPKVLRFTWPFLVLAVAVATREIEGKTNQSTSSRGSRSGLTLAVLFNMMKKSYLIAPGQQGPTNEENISEGDQCLLSESSSQDSTEAPPPTQGDAGQAGGRWWSGSMHSPSESSSLLHSAGGWWWSSGSRGLTSKSDYILRFEIFCMYSVVANIGCLMYKSLSSEAWWVHIVVFIGVDVLWNFMGLVLTIFNFLCVFSDEDKKVFPNKLSAFREFQYSAQAVIDAKGGS